ncbi:MAG TPA: CDP-glycerol glycerophosphotransferase family protein [Gemmatimonadaceae bacterium]
MMQQISRARARVNPKVAVLLPMVWSVRNVVYSGALDRLAREGVSVHLFVRQGSSPDHEAYDETFSAAAAHEPLLYSAGRHARGKALLDGIVRSAFSRRHSIASYALYRHWFNRNDGPALRIRSAAIEAMGAACQAQLPFNALCRMTERLYRRSHDLTDVRAQLARCRPDLLWSTVCISPREYPYIIAARDLGIPVVTSILSFDNLTSRGRLPRFDRYLVWNERMRDRLLRFYPYIAPADVMVTGTPQFDFHRRPEFHWSRERTLERLGLPPRSRYFLYSTSHISLAPEEPALVQQIAARLRESDTLAQHQLVVRLHPLDDGARWLGISHEFPQLRVSPAWDSVPDADCWTLSSREDQSRLVSTIAHADACVNVASTMSLDAAILDRPVINIDFTSERDTPRGLMYTEYEADHYKPLVMSNGIRMARSWEELLSLLERAVSDPTRDSRERAEMARTECGMVDGKAAQRVADTIIGLLGETGRRRAPSPDGRTATVSSTATPPARTELAS